MPYVTKYRTAYKTAEQDIGFELIPVCRPKFVFFQFVGLRPNVPHWIFFDGQDVTKWINTSYSFNDYDYLPKNSDLRIPGDKYISANKFPFDQGGATAATGPLQSSSNGTIEGCFYIQSNTTTSFPAGKRTMAAIDISVLNKENCLSYAETEYIATGEYDLFYEYQQSYEESYQEFVAPPAPAKDNGGGGGGGGGGKNNNGRNDILKGTQKNDGRWVYTYVPASTVVRPKPRPDNLGKEKKEKSVICTELYSRGLLSLELYKLDVQYTNTYLSKNIVNGYHWWAIPMVKRMRHNETWIKIWLYFATLRAKEIAHIIDPINYTETTLWGKTFKKVGEGICNAIGLFVQESDYSTLYINIDQGTK